MKVFLVDDHPFTLLGIQEVLNDEPDMEVVGVANTGREALEKIPACQPEVVVLDCHLPDRKGAAVAAEIKSQGWPMEIVALSGYDDLETVHEMLAAGARAYVIKMSYVQELVLAIRSVVHGYQWFSQKIWELLEQGGISEPQNGQEEEEEEEEEEETGLTQQQHEILHRVALGHTDSQIAVELGVTTKAINRQLGRILARLRAPNRANAVYKATKRRWI